ncbi:unnamed protein product [Albugo candida]|uniref:Uncharacterized protein n=1 Tax=Albugo candida TaxID=65357 RepID=A0A024GRA8_9STRA|nr:unnamed protein product [Albugo candida]|eukprot:CCI48883.1 unnamed protein product [Albugo candida]
MSGVMINAATFDRSHEDRLSSFSKEWALDASWLKRRIFMVRAVQRVLANICVADAIRRVSIANNYSMDEARLFLCSTPQMTEGKGKDLSKENYHYSIWKSHRRHQKVVQLGLYYGRNQKCFISGLLFVI